MLTDKPFYQRQLFRNLIYGLNSMIIQAGVLIMIHKIHFMFNFYTIFMVLFGILSFLFLSSAEESNTIKMLNILLEFAMISAAVYVMSGKFEYLIFNQYLLLLIKSLQIILFGAVHLIFVGTVVSIFIIIFSKKAKTTIL